ncbi:MAG: hypothetical protein ACRD0A_06245 [Acidimicrobiales bacterium]
MTDEHKAALSEGRLQGRAVRRYLEALEAHKPKRGRKRTSDSIKKRLAKIDAELPEADRVKSLHLVQERIDLESELAGMDETVDLTALENDFVKAAAPYSQRRGISYTAWRTLGVPAAVLKQAGVRRGG